MIISVFDRVENIVGKRKIACTSNFSFSHYVFKRLLSQRCQKVSLCGNGLRQNANAIQVVVVQVHSKSRILIPLPLIIHLTLYHTIPTFNDPETEGFSKHFGERRKCWYPAFSPFPTTFSILLKPNLNFSFIFILWSANVFSLNQCKILSFGRVNATYRMIQ